MPKSGLLPKTYSGAQVASAHGRGGAARRPSHVLYLKRLQNAIDLDCFFTGGYYEGAGQGRLALTAPVGGGRVGGKLIQSLEKIRTSLCTP